MRVPGPGRVRPCGARRHRWPARCDILSSVGDRLPRSSDAPPGDRDGEGTDGDRAARRRTMVGRGTTGAAADRGATHPGRPRRAERRSAPQRGRRSRVLGPARVRSGHRGRRSRDHRHAAAARRRRRADRAARRPGPVADRPAPRTGPRHRPGRPAQGVRRRGTRTGRGAHDHPPAVLRSGGCRRHQPQLGRGRVPGAVHHDPATPEAADVHPGADGPRGRLGRRRVHRRLGGRRRGHRCGTGAGRPRRRRAGGRGPRGGRRLLTLRTRRDGAAVLAGWPPPDGRRQRHDDRRGDAGRRHDRQLDRLRPPAGPRPCPVAAGARTRGSGQLRVRHPPRGGVGADLGDGHLQRPQRSEPAPGRRRRGAGMVLDRRHPQHRPGDLRRGPRRPPRLR